MSSNNINKNIPFNFTDLVHNFATFKDHIFSVLNCHQIGTIENFYPETQTCDVSVNTKRRISINPDRWSDYPLLVDCPVQIIRGGNASITMPIKQGDECLILFNDREIDNWFSNGGIQPFTLPRTHDLSDGLVIVGFSSLVKVLSNYNIDAIELNNNNTAKISIYEDHIEILAPINSVDDIVSNFISLQHHKHMTDTGLTSEPLPSE